MKGGAMANEVTKEVAGRMTKNL